MRILKRVVGTIILLFGCYATLQLWGTSWLAL
jgi:hypothetical protein